MGVEYDALRPVVRVPSDGSALAARSDVRPPDGQEGDEELVDELTTSKAPMGESWSNRRIREAGSEKSRQRRRAERGGQEPTVRGVVNHRTRAVSHVPLALPIWPSRPRGGRRTLPLPASIQKDEWIE